MASSSPTGLIPLASMDLKIQRNVINFDENVKIPRRIAEGREPLFNRPELQDWIRNNMMKDDLSGDSDISSINLMESPPAAATNESSLDSYEITPQKSQHVISEFGSDSRPHSHSKDEAKRKEKIKTEKIKTEKTREKSKASSSHSTKTKRKIDIRKSLDRRSSSRESRNKVMRKRSKRSRSRSRSQSKESRSWGYRGHARPSKVLHVTWLGDSGLPIYKDKYKDECLSKILFGHFRKLAPSSILKRVERSPSAPFYTWLIYESIEDALDALNSIQRRLKNGKKFYFGVGEITLEFPYKVGFSNKQTFDP